MGTEREQRHHGRRRSVGFASLLALVLGACLTAAAGAAQERLLVGLLLSGREVGTLEVWREDGLFWLPMASLTEVVGIVVEESGEDLEPILHTPLGVVALDRYHVRMIEGERFVSETFLERRLATSVEFELEEFALRLDVPWADGFVAERFARVAEIGAPTLSLSTLRADLLYLNQGSSQRLTMSTTLSGRIGGGSWRTRFERDFQGDSTLREYGWLRTQGHHLFLVGRQTVDLHPLLNSLELTGVQAAWTNQPLDLFPRSFQARELLPRSVQPVSTFRGAAPAGSIAELRIDGLVVDEQTVNLSGFYEFLEVRLPARQVSRVEVMIFDRNNPSVPIAIHEKRLSASEFLLSKGAIVHMGGAGRSGNLLGEGEGFAGFYQFRYGVAGGLTVEAALQEANGRRQMEAGIVSRLARGFFLDFGVARSIDRLGYNLGLQGQSRRWRLFARSLLRPANFDGRGFDQAADHYLDVEYRPSSFVAWSLVGRYRSDASGRQEFLLPALNWQPSWRASLRARPNSEGRYRLDAAFQVSPRLRLALLHEDFTAADVSVLLGSRHRLSFRAESMGQAGTSFSSVISRQRLKRGSLAWSLGAVVNNGQPGVLVAADLPLRSGILARAELQTVPFSSRVGPLDEPRIFFGITADLGLAGGRLSAADTFGISGGLGAVSGRLRTDGGGWNNLGGLPILIDGRIRSKTDSGGSFFVGNLREGIYQVELDPERLPIELVLKVRSRTVEVAAGAVTRVEFLARPEYGLAGRVMDLHGLVVASTRVELLDESGRRVGTAVTDRFGLYRMEGLVAGLYILRIAPENWWDPAVPPPTLEVEVRDDYLFNQDLQVVRLPPPRGASTD